MLLEFSEAMYSEMEGFVGRRLIFGRALDVVDSDRLTPPVGRHFARPSLVPREPPMVGVKSPHVATPT